MHTRNPIKGTDNKTLQSWPGPFPKFSIIINLKTVNSLDTFDSFTHFLDIGQRCESSKAAPAHSIATLRKKRRAGEFRSSEAAARIRRRNANHVNEKSRMGCTRQKPSGVELSQLYATEPPVNTRIESVETRATREFSLSQFCTVRTTQYDTTRGARARCTQRAFRRCSLRSYYRQLAEEAPSSFLFLFSDSIKLKSSNFLFTYFSCEKESVSATRRQWTVTFASVTLLRFSRAVREECLYHAYELFLLAKAVQYPEHNPGLPLPVEQGGHELEFRTGRLSFLRPLSRPVPCRERDIKTGVSDYQKEYR